jgi:hypothetical protein
MPEHKVLDIKAQGSDCAGSIRNKADVMITAVHEGTEGNRIYTYLFLTQEQAIALREDLDRAVEGNTGEEVTVDA